MKIGTRSSPNALTEHNLHALMLYIDFMFINTLQQSTLYMFNLYIDMYLYMYTYAYMCVCARPSNNTSRLVVYSPFDERSHFSY